MNDNYYDHATFVQVHGWLSRIYNEGWSAEPKSIIFLSATHTLPVPVILVFKPVNF